MGHSSIHVTFDTYGTCSQAEGEKPATGTKIDGRSPPEIRSGR